MSLNPQRNIFCNRTLNLRSISAIGYDMDYTLIHYDVRAWEERAYETTRQKLLARGWPVGHLSFDPDIVMRGLIIDTELGNIVKANRFGYIKRATHGTQRMSFDAQRGAYARTIIDLAEPRWVFMNTFFSVSEACLYAQLVDLLDERRLPEEVRDCAQLYRQVRLSLDAAHMEGELKAEIIADPERFVILDPDIPKALLDQREAGKRLLLITNSGWAYTREMMDFAFNPSLPAGTTWRDIFEVVIVSARKPAFFSQSSPIFEVIDDDGLLRPAPTGIQSPGHYLGGDASMIERYLGLDGSRILYVGDHLHGDVHVSKSIRRWRTALILRELEDEIAALQSFQSQQRMLAQLMSEKIALEAKQDHLRLQLQRASITPDDPSDTSATRDALDALQKELSGIDAQISPLAIASGKLHNSRWGLLMRAGNDKSHLARQVERHADIYCSRVSNFLFKTPFAYMRSSRGSLPHDADIWMPQLPPQETSE